MATSGSCVYAPLGNLLTLLPPTCPLCFHTFLTRSLFGHEELTADKYALQIINESFLNGDEVITASVLKARLLWKEVISSLTLPAPLAESFLRSCSGQEIICLLWNHIFHCCSHKIRQWSISWPTGKFLHHYIIFWETFYFDFVSNAWGIPNWILYAFLMSSMHLHTLRSAILSWPKVLLKSAEPLKNAFGRTAGKKYGSRARTCA